MVQPVPDQTHAQSDAPITVSDPNEVGKRSFEVRRKGFDQDEVRSYLGAVANALADAQRREAEMRSRLAKAVRRAEDAVAKAEAVSAADYTEKLGDEVSRVLDATRVAAEERTARSVAEANTIVENARTEAESIKKEAQGVLGLRTSEAEEVARNIIDTADTVAGERTQEAEEVLERARETGMEHLQKAEDEAASLVNQAESARTQILKDMDRRRRSMRAQVEQLKAARDRLLESHDVMRNLLDDASQELRHSLIDAKVKGEAATRRVGEVRFATPDELEAEIADAAMIGAVSLPALDLRDNLDYEEVLGELPQSAKPEKAKEPKAAATAAKPVVRLQVDGADSAPDTKVAKAAPAASAAKTVSAPTPPAKTAKPATTAKPEKSVKPAAAAKPVAPTKPATKAKAETATPASETKAAAATTAPVTAKAPKTVGQPAPVLAHPAAKRASAAAAEKAASAELDEALLAPEEDDDEFDPPLAASAELSKGATPSSIFDRLRSDPDTDVAPSADGKTTTGKSEAKKAEPKAAKASADTKAPPKAKKPTKAKSTLSKKTTKGAKAKKASTTSTDPAVQSGSANADAKRDDADREVAGPAARRDLAVADLETRVARGLKRVLVDEQSVMLETTDMSYSGALIDVLPDLEHHADLFLDAVMGPLAEAWTAGAVFMDPGASVGAPSRDRFEAAVNNLVIGPIREELQKIDPSVDSAAATTALRAFYRKHKVERITEAASYLTLFAFSAGSLAAAGTADVQWVHVEHEAGCSDGHDNELSGPQKAGEVFPSGTQSPPIAPGCRCLLIQPQR